MDRAFLALSDPVRRALVARLSRGAATVNELAEPFAITKQAVSKHIRVLEEAGLIATSKDGRVRTCAIVPEALDPVRRWLDEQRVIWEARLDRLDAFVMKAMKDREG